MHQIGKAVEVDSLSEDEVVRLSSAPASCTTLTIWKPSFGSNLSPIPYLIPPISSTKGEHPTNDEKHKKTMTSKHASCPLSKCENFSQLLLPSLFFFFLLTFTIHVFILKNRILSESWIFLCFNLIWWNYCVYELALRSGNKPRQFVRIYGLTWPIYFYSLNSSFKNNTIAIWWDIHSL